MIEETVVRLFDEVAARQDHVAIDPLLQKLGWSEIEAEYPVAACALLFRTQGRCLALTDALDRVMLAELAPLVDAPVDCIVLPTLSQGSVPSSNEGQMKGIVLGPLRGRVVVPVSDVPGTVSVTVVDSDQLRGDQLDTFDASVVWTWVEGSIDGDLVDASTEWGRAISAAHRSLATELIALADTALRLAVEHTSVRVQFGSPIGSLQSPRHALAAAAARLEGARAVLDDSWWYGGLLSAQVAKAAAGRAHRAVSDAVLQVCGAMGLTAEHDLHRYVTRGFQIDALCGSYLQLESLLADRLFDVHAPERALPAIINLD
ncbi:acyl-CoA dehydrogenase family protein [Mycolicibacterium thermoresistibile]|uniref:Acyl-CoA dehydrogenase n=2 Tax=Mycolicibacterium thermoresistibile TaxID=1797 RepID=G7CGB6_MYCT3|nr:acyl-CoA dehydrogenase [Mycolicibacterium thermoresistibile ATCC 19527]MCV7186785.1 acyl-CoA dehydrogenase [Mycolicibacterium thermoresistibile]